MSDDGRLGVGAIDVSIEAQMTPPQKGQVSSKWGEYRTWMEGWDPNAIVSFLLPGYGVLWSAGCRWGTL